MNTPRTKENTLLIRVAIGLLTLAMLGASYLLFVALKNGPVAGCGEGSGCDVVLKSRFAYLLPGVPVTVPALLIYAALLVCIAKRKSLRESGVWSLATLTCALLILGAAVCFIAIQAIKLKHFCPYCMATHLVGSAGAILAVLGLGLLDRQRIGALVTAGLFAGGGLAVMLACQYFLPQKTYLTTDAGGSAEKTTGKTFSLGDASINLDDMPFKGNADSEKLMVLLFDYTCGSCRTTHRYLHRAEKRFGLDNYLVVGIPVPLNPKCNPAFTDASPQHADACEHARLALALWRLDREAFREWDHWMFEGGTASSAPTPAEAIAKAESLVDPAQLKASLADPWIKEQIARNIELWKTMKTKAGRMTMPQMILGGRLVVGAPDSEFQLYDLMRDGLELTPVTP
jgi:uncharacterized membrane protein